MPNYVVQIGAYFSDTVDVEADNEDEAARLAVRQFEDEYTVTNNFGLPWDNVEAESVDLEDEDY